MAAALSALGLTASAPVPAADAKPNVLFIAIDDLRDWVGYLGHAQAKTPNLDRLAAMGTAFTRSYCAVPLCNPSRTALLTGRRAGHTGVYGNETDWRTAMPDVLTLPQHFKNSGYRASGAGKIYHVSFARPGDWDEFLNGHEAMQKLGPANRKGEGKPTDEDGIDHLFRFGPLDTGDESMADYWTVEYALRELAKPQRKPLFLGCGLMKPHLPWFVPRKYFDMFPLEAIRLPEVMESDLGDVPPIGVRMASPQGDHAKILQKGIWKKSVQAYLATIAFTDAMIGKLLDGFEKSPLRANTIIVCWSDHGWHLGEKQHWRKYTLWEEAARAPFIFVAPGITKPGSICARTMDYMSIYPTLCDLCGIAKPDHLEGVSIAPLLRDPVAPWDRPAITTHTPGDHAVRTERWRYIRYSDGTDELYDHDADPHEWTNLASDPMHAATKADLAKWIPTDDRPVPAGREGKKGKGKKSAAGE